MLFDFFVFLLSFMNYFYLKDIVYRYLIGLIVLKDFYFLFRDSLLDFLDNFGDASKILISLQFLMLFIYSGCKSIYPIFFKTDVFLSNKKSFISQIDNLFLIFVIVSIFLYISYFGPIKNY